MQDERQFKALIGKRSLSAPIGLRKAVIKLIGSNDPIYDILTLMEYRIYLQYFKYKKFKFVGKIGSFDPIFLYL